MPTRPQAGSPALDHGETGGVDLVDGLVRLSFTVQALLARLADEHDLTVTQLRMLGVLIDREVGMQQLARILELEKSSVSGLVDRAERRGLVRRIPVPGNGRATHVVLTPAAQSLAAAARRGVRAEIDRLTEGLGVEQQRVLRHAVASVLEAYTARYAIPL